MKMKSNLFAKQFFRFASATAVFGLSGLIVFGQERADNKSRNKDFCSNYDYSYNDKVPYKETREVSLPTGSLVNVDGKRNGGIKVTGENRSDVLVRACVQTVGATDEEARAAARNIRIETGSQIRAESSDGESNSAVSYEILVPRATNLKLLAHNGGISISSVEGMVEFETTNGGVNLSDVAGDVFGKTRNGGVNVALTGDQWRGGGLSVETTNGGVNLSMPENYRARVETGTVNGGFRSNIAGLNLGEDDNRRTRRKRISADLNGGGAPVRVTTTNGGVTINASTKNL